MFKKKKKHPGKICSLFCNLATNRNLPCIYHKWRHSETKRTGRETLITKHLSFKFKFCSGKSEVENLCFSQASIWQDRSLCHLKQTRNKEILIWKPFSTVHSHFHIRKTFLSLFFRHLFPLLVIFILIWLPQKINNKSCWDNRKRRRSLTELSEYLSHVLAFVTNS